jgi:1-acyl-sn-glycerol-3-phosphate acyltransferase
MTTQPIPFNPLDKRVHPLQRRLIRALICGLLRLLTRVRSQGVENIPARGACILAANHFSRLDAPLVFAVCERRDLTALIAADYRSVLPLRWLVDAIGGIWVRRGEPDLTALRVSQDLLRAGGALGLAPEGTRSHTGGLIPAHSGAAYLADRAGALVVPTAIWGTEHAMRQVMRLRRPEIYIRFGEARRLPPVNRRSREADLQRNTDEIMLSIARLLPEGYRGVYADRI